MAFQLGKLGRTSRTALATPLTLAFALGLPFAAQAETLTLYTSQPNADAQQTVDAFMAAAGDLVPIFAEDGCKPVSTLLEVNQLFEPELMVELEATAVA